MHNSAIRILFSKEIHSLFLSKTPWIILASIQLVISLQFLTFIEKYLEIQLLKEVSLNITEIIISPLYGAISMILLLVVPLLTMSQISGERSNKTLSLLLSSPIPTYAIVLGKYFSTCLFLTLCVCVLSLMPLILSWGSSVDLGHTLSAIVGVLLIVYAYTAINLWLSSIAKYPAIAAIYGLGLLLLFWLMSQTSSNVENNLLVYFSPFSHLHYFILGSIQTEHIIYFILLSIYFVYLTMLSLVR